MKKMILKLQDYGPKIVIIKTKLFEIIRIFLSFLIIIFMFICAFTKISAIKSCFDINSIGIFAAQLSMPKTFYLKSPDEKEEISVEEQENIFPKNGETEYEPKGPKEVTKNTPMPPQRVIEISASGVKNGIFLAKNGTDREVDFNFYLNKFPDIKIKDKNHPLVLIYHTHTTESYLPTDNGTISKDFYPRTCDAKGNVVAVGEEIVKALKANGIKSIHDTTMHDYPLYNGSYSRSETTIKKNLKKNPSIKITIDVHRDSMGDIKTIFKKSGEKCAQIMMVSGSGFPNWEKNLSLALAFQKNCETMFPGMTRALSLRNARYNQNLTTGSLLVEIGTDKNSISEAKRSGKILGESLAKFIEKLIVEKPVVEIKKPKVIEKQITKKPIIAAKNIKKKA
ncbi:MAG: stage II sporulation protein P [Oscillospiraceae bacterium]|jgi:stage II sporulation protein P|nr:stage II sporulation protein P [Oscillospiraceae bacterium]